MCSTVEIKVHDHLVVKTVLDFARILTKNLIKTHENTVQEVGILSDVVGVVIIISFYCCDASVRYL